MNSKTGTNFIDSFKIISSVLINSVETFSKFEGFLEIYRTLKYFYKFCFKNLTNTQANLLNYI